MSFSYDKLWKKLIDEKMNKLDLQKTIKTTPRTIAKMGRDENVSIDNKAYSTGYNLPINQADEMIRYIEENQTRDKKINPNKWWESFDDKVKDFNYLFVSSFFKGNFKNNLKHIANRTGVNGGAINVENLLYLAEELKSGRLSYFNSFYIYDNDEIYLGNISDYSNVKFAAEEESKYLT